MRPPRTTIRPPSTSASATKDGALDEYAASINLDPTGDLADDALWWERPCLEKQSRWDEADRRSTTGSCSSSTRPGPKTPPSGRGWCSTSSSAITEAANAWDSAARRVEQRGDACALLGGEGGAGGRRQERGARSTWRSWRRTIPSTTTACGRRSPLGERTRSATPLPAVRSRGAGGRRRAIVAGIGQRRAAGAGLDVLAGPALGEGQELLAVGLPRDRRRRSCAT